MNKNILIIIFVALLLNITVGLSVAQNSVPAVIVRVLDEERGVMAGVLVRVEELSHLSTYTDENSEAIIILPTDWVGDMITILVYKDGYYQPFPERIRVLNDIQRTTIRLHTLDIVGYVTDSLTGTPIEEAIVRIVDPVQPPLRTASDSTGYFMIRSNRLLGRTPPKVKGIVEKEGCISKEVDLLMIRRYNIIRLNCTPTR